MKLCLNLSGLGKFWTLTIRKTLNLWGPVLFHWVKIYLIIDIYYVFFPNIVSVIFLSLIKV